MNFIDLSFSKNLLRSPYIFVFLNLQRLVLEGCTGLVEVHASLELHKKLIVVNFKDFENLTTLPTKMDMSSLEDLILSSCSKVKKFSEFGESMQHLSTLYAKRTSITKLPQSLGCLVGLSVLSLKDCKQLVCLPNTIHNLKSLKILEIFVCSKLSRLPEGLKEVKCLKNLDASGTAMEELPSSIFYLENLEALSCEGCEGPVSKSGNLLLPFQWLFGSRPVSMGYKKPPNDIGCLSSLCNLNLSGNNFINLPSTIFNLSMLQGLHLNRCRRLQSLLERPSAIEPLHAGNCTALETSRFDPSSPCNLLAATKQMCSTGKGYDGVNPLMAIRRFLQEMQVPRPRFDLVIPGSEIPSWFDHQIIVSS